MRDPAISASTIQSGPMTFRRGPATPVRALVIVLAMLGVGACGSEPDPEAAFCDDVRGFVEYQGELGIAVFVPEETEAFFKGSVERITALAEAAPPTIAAEVAIVRDAFVRLDQNLAVVAYDVTALTEEQLDTSSSDQASDAIDEFLATACRRDGDPFSGFADDPLAPLVLSPGEIDDLEGGVESRDGELEALVSAQLADVFGLSMEQSACIVDGLGMSFIASFTGGGGVTEDDSKQFLAQLDACGIDADAIVGEP